MFPDPNPPPSDSDADEGSQNYNNGLNPAWRKWWSVVNESVIRNSCIRQKLTQSV